MSAFDQQKRRVLASVDLSRKGSVDEPIRHFIKYLNEHRDFGKFFFYICNGMLDCLVSVFIFLCTHARIASYSQPR